MARPIDHIDWTELDYSALKPGTVVQNDKTHVYAIVIEEPDADSVMVETTEGPTGWPLWHLTWRRKTMAPATFGKEAA